MLRRKKADFQPESPECGQKSPETVAPALRNPVTGGGINGYGGSNGPN